MMAPTFRSTAGVDNSMDRGVYKYTLRIFVNDGSPEVDVKVSITFKESLELITKKTPIEFTFSSDYYYIFYDTLNKATSVRAELDTNQFESKGVPFGHFPASHSGSSGRGKFIRDPDHNVQVSGGLL
ncbi:hypothetical protein [Thalassomonas haliotis]|uniref:SMODS-associating 2TM beta-strand rich effector domain-containing protein n=1 Tax=Thalassomonas haliotis TaxID=485448 RepID=A0ABY7VFD1_9GAMM|nr:hypothetical protein [Thalassomonas haliotis]WDE12331.1 hypothetical protein H3N35_02265 [Thalassomonas haliotis]